MSSMFKKKGGLAFKPKIPSARPRPAVPATDVQVEKDVAETEAASIAAVESPSVETREGSSIVAGTSESENVASREPSSVAEADSTAASEPPAQDVSGLKPQEQPIPTVEQQPSAPEPSTTPSTTQPSEEEAEAATASPSLPLDQPSAPKPREPLPVIADDNIAPELRDPPRAPQGPQDHVPETESNEATPAPPPAPKTRSRRKAPESAAAPDSVDDHADAEARPKKRQRKTPANEDGSTAPKPRQKRKSPTQDGTATPRTRARRARSVTPDDAESQVVDLQNLKMTDLTKDLHIGKKFSRHDELRERERQSRIKSKLKKLMGDGSRDESEPPETSPDDPSVKSKSATPTTTTAAAAALPSSTPAPASGPQFRIVDGQIIIDQSSLVMDRHARAAATRGDMETVEENDFTRLITSSSFMNTSKLKGPNIWTEEETELFYRGLRMFGTEFEMISKMFPNKQRRHVKLKYNREERHCPHLINAALIGEKTVRIDIDEYKAFTGIEFESVESIEAEQRKIQEDFEAEQKRIADEQAEVMRQKREELFADEDNGRKGKKGKKKGKQAVQYGLNGEPILAGEA
ncbi:Transcription factor TFIIIB component B [Trichoderma ghanense]|uniref:Transcription factor TFIIIB component B n=1 Tax=Trichoderma ghanense TaxID=65468 RepID=A0ABY2HAJ5_9HYPO